MKSVYTPCWRMEGRDIPPLILNFDTRWWWEVTFTSQPSYLRGKLTIGWETGWTWNPSGYLEQSKNAASAGNQTQTVGSFIPWRSNCIDCDVSGCYSLCGWWWPRDTCKLMLGTWLTRPDACLHMNAWYWVHNCLHVSSFKPVKFHFHSWDSRN